VRFAGIVLNHDHDRYFIACYSGVAWPDAMTHRFQTAADLWRSTVELPDEALARASSRPRPKLCSPPQR
jgi:hypothetical protein